MQSKISNLLLKIVQKVGYDNTAFIFWTIASIFWNIGFIYPTQHKIGPHATNLSRGLGMVLLNGLGLYWRQLFTNQPTPYKDMKKQQVVFLVIRHLLLAIYGYGFAEAQYYLPSPVLYTIYFSGPLFLLILEYFCYGMTLNQRQIKGVILTGIGVILTSNGQLIWAWITNDDTFHTTFKNYKTDSFIIKSLAALILVILTFGWACSILIVRKVQGHSHWTINFNYGVVMTIVSGFTYSIYSDKVIQQNPIQFVHLFFKLGLITAFGQIFFMSALLLTKKLGQVSIIGFVSVIFSYFLSVFRYNEPINFLCVFGSLAALFGIYHIVIK